MPKAIGIYFGDNDFCNVAWGFLKGLKHSGIENVTKPQIVKAWNLSVGGIYVLWQCFSDINNLEIENVNYISDYLKISEKHVYFDNEVDRYLQNAFLNSEFAVIDERNPALGSYCYTT